VVDGLQNPLQELAAASGYFLPRGRYLDPLDRERRWAFTPAARPGDAVRAGDTIGTVPEGEFVHRIMVPFGLLGWWTVRSVADAGDVGVADVVATLEDERGRARDVTVLQRWPVKTPIRAYRERLRPDGRWSRRSASSTRCSRSLAAAPTASPDRSERGRRCCSS
jgi:V/A-type H+/Na+-transporting ATPase subunit A